jgi:hypothetical protein
VSLLPTMKVRRSVLEAALALKAQYGSRAMAVAEERRDAGWRARDTTGDFWNAVKIHLQGTKGQPWRRPYIGEDAGQGWPPVSRPGAEPVEEDEGLDFGAGDPNRPPEPDRSHPLHEARVWTGVVLDIAATGWRELKEAIREKKKGGGST